MKCMRFLTKSQIVDYLDNNWLIAHCCSFNIMEPLPSTGRMTASAAVGQQCVEVDHGGSGEENHYEMGIVDASFIGLDSTPLQQIP